VIADSAPGHVAVLGSGVRARADGPCLAAVVTWALLLGGCATGGVRQATSAALDEPPWSVPAAAVPRQYLLRLDAQGPDGRVDFKLTVRLESAERFHITAADPLGRRLWSLDVAGRAGVWSRGGPAGDCRLDVRGDLRLPELQLDLPVDGLPALLLGRLPVAPRDRETVVRSGERWPGADGRVWSATFAGHELVRWTVWNATAPMAWWRAAPNGGELALRDPAMRLRWRLVAAAPLAAPLGGLATSGDLSALPECTDALP
jgi:hypothetical protein